MGKNLSTLSQRAANLEQQLPSLRASDGDLQLGANLLSLTGMRVGTALWVYLFFVFIGAALLAPWVFYGFQELATQSTSLQGLARIPFRRVIDRCLLLLAFAGLWPLIKELGFRTWREVGLPRDRPIWRDLGKGLAIGSFLMALAALSSIAAGTAHLEPGRPPSAWLKQLISALLTAAIVGFSEELFFRGAIFTAFRRTWNGAASLWVSGAIYAIVHFFARPENPAHVEWHSGFQTLGSMLKGFTVWQSVIPGFLSLTLLGVVLALAFKKTGALFMSMGIHASLVFWIKLYASGADPVPGANVWFWGTDKLIDGWLCFILLSATALWMARRPRQSS